MSGKMLRLSHKIPEVKAVGFNLRRLEKGVFRSRLGETIVTALNKDIIGTKSMKRDLTIPTLK